MSEQVDQVVIFDPERNARELRYDRALRAFEHLNLDIDREVIRLTGDRHECVEFLIDQPGYTLLLSDMLDQRDIGTVGNVGARLLRAVSRHRDLASQVWRILWSEYDHPTVIDDIEPYAHAFVWFDYDDRDSVLLFQAVSYVLGGPPSEDAQADAPSRPFRWFAPRGWTVEDHKRIWRDTLRGLLREGRELKVNDEIAAASILRDVPDTVTNATLREQRRAAPQGERRTYCESVDEMLERMRGDKKQARRDVVAALETISQETIATNLTPLMVERAGELMDQYRRPTQLRYKTLLTEAEDELARVLVDRYEHHVDALGVHGNDGTGRYTALDLALLDDEVQTALTHPELGVYTQTEERKVETLSYVICAYNDTSRSRAG